MPPTNQNTKKILEKYSKVLESELSQDPSSNSQAYSQEYSTFRDETIPELSRYEKWAKSLGNLIKINVSEKDRIKIQKHLDIAHLDVTPSQSMTLSIMAFLAVFFVTLATSAAITFIQGGSLDDIPIFFAFLGILTSLFIFYYAYSMPLRIANAWRLQASSQMVPAILYLVVYMKHTSNLERAINFASEHLEGPLALDFKKIFYDVEIGKYSTIKQSLEIYLETWREYTPEFIESIHLIESSLFEPVEERRVQILERALQVMLEGIYEKMLKYSREIRSPLTNIYMLGIVLPTLGLALLPLASTLMGGIFQWHHIMILFNVIIPFFVFYLTSEVLLKRPGGYGEAQLIEKNPNYPQYKSKKPWLIAALITIPLLIIGFLPFIFQISLLTTALNIKSDYSFQEIGIPYLGETRLFDFKTEEGTTTGPFGPLAILLSLFIPLSIALFFSITYSLKTKKIIQSREDTKSLEEEFTNSLFQLGNRLSNGIPAEISMSKIAQENKGLKTEFFFARINQNIQKLGYSLEKAIFDQKTGAIISYPSALVSTSMKILVESAKKGLDVAAKSIKSIAEYVKNIQKINHRLKDLLAEIVSDMKSNMTFLAPLLSGIVIGLASMITTILNKLHMSQLTQQAENLEAASMFGGIPDIFVITEMIPPYFLQIIIGIYIIEIIFILTAALVTINSGKDTIKEKNELARNLRTGIILYTGTALAAILSLTILAAVALGNLA